MPFTIVPLLRMVWVLSVAAFYDTYVGVLEDVSICLQTNVVWYPFICKQMAMMSFAKCVICVTSA